MGFGDLLAGKRRKLRFDDAAKFNYELDTNGKLKDALKNLSLRRGEMSRRRYLTELLTLFNEEGFDLTLKELDMLLLLRNKTDQLLLETEDRRKTDVHDEG